MNPQKTEWSADWKKYSTADKLVKFGQQEFSHDLHDGEDSNCRVMWSRWSNNWAVLNIRSHEKMNENCCIFYWWFCHYTVLLFNGTAWAPLTECTRHGSISAFCSYRKETAWKEKSIRLKKNVSHTVCFTYKWFHFQSRLNCCAKCAFVLSGHQPLDGTRANIFQKKSPCIFTLVTNDKSKAALWVSTNTHLYVLIQIALSPCALELAFRHNRWKQ